METWRPIRGYEGLYEVSNTGKVRSVDRKTPRKDNSVMVNKGRELKLNTTPKGYLRVTITKECKKKNFLVHRLVAEAFVLNLEELEQVNHLDGNKANNDFSNLEWTTNYQNHIHAEYEGLRPPELRSRPVQQLTLDGEVVGNYPSISACAKHMGIKDSRVGDVCHGRRKSAHGYRFKFI